MKKLLSVMIAVVLVFAMTACGGEEEKVEAAEFTSALNALEQIQGTYSEDEAFPIAGGDSENPVVDAPGAFDIAKTDELDVTLGLPADLAGKIDDAASMLHMMNANTFTAAAYHLVDASEFDAFKDAVTENILARQWMCGMPDTLIVAQGNDGYVVTAFGEAEIMETFKAKVESLGMKISVEKAIAE